MRYNPEFGVYSMEFGDAAIVAERTLLDGLWHYATDHGLPLPSSWYLDELGIHFLAYEGTLNQYGDFQFVPFCPLQRLTTQTTRAIQTNKPQSVSRCRHNSMLAVAAPSSSSRLWTFSHTSWLL